MTESKKIALKYIGDGTQLGQVPTRDLTSDEVKQYGRAWLLASGLFAEAEPETAHIPKPTKSAFKPIKTQNKEEE